jgi:hypothetical protein
MKLAFLVTAGAMLVSTSGGLAGRSVDKNVTMVAWPAPIGHRQPRAVDILVNGRAWQVEVDKLDRSLDRRLQICRGC